MTYSRERFNASRRPKYTDDDLRSEFDRVQRGIPHPTVIDIRDFGPRRNGTADDSGAIRQALRAARDTGGVAVVYVPGGNYLMDSQAVIYSNTTLYLDRHAVLLRNWANATSDKKQATIINENHPAIASYIVDPGPFEPATWDENISILGPGGFQVTEDAEDDANDNAKFAGPHISLLAVNQVRLSGLQMQTTTREWNLVLHANNFDIDGLTILGGSQVFEDGIHIFGGAHGRIRGCHVESGDDALVIGTNYNLAASDIVMSGNYVNAQRGHALRLVQLREGSTAAFAPSTEAIERIVVTGLVGKGGVLRNGVVRIDTDSGSEDTVRDIRVDGFVLAHGSTATHDDTNAQGIILNGGHRMFFRGSIKSPVKAGVIASDCTDLELDLDLDGAQDSGQHSVQLTDCTRVMVKGSVRCGTSAIGVTASASDFDVDGLTIRDIPSGLYGIRLQGASTLRATRYRPVKASGASGTFAFRGENTSVQIVHSDCNFAGVDDIASYSATPASIRSTASLFTATRTIASGATVYRGEDILKVLGEGAASDDLVSISGAFEGQEVVVVSGEVSPGTVVVTAKANTGVSQLNIGTDYALDTANKGLKLRFQNSRWQQVARW